MYSWIELVVCSAITGLFFYLVGNIVGVLLTKKKLKQQIEEAIENGKIKVLYK